MPTQKQIVKTARRLARRYKVPERLFLSLIQHESGFNPTARSPAGAYGLAQLMPGTAQGLGVNPANWRQNLIGGARYLSQQFKTFGEWPLALAAYNAGPGAVQKYNGIPPYSETQAYVRNVLGGQKAYAQQAPTVTRRAATATAPAMDERRQWGLDTLQDIASGSWDPLKVLAEVRSWGGTLTPPKRNGKLPGVGDAKTPPVMQKILSAAHAQIGKPYVWGGENPSEGGFDCSGLLDWAFRQAGIDLPGRLTTYSAMKLGQSVKGKPYKPGDFLIVNGGKHMVMYVGNGKVIAAPYTGSTVQYQPASRFKGDIVDVRRVL